MGELLKYCFLCICFLAVSCQSGEAKKQKDDAPSVTTDVQVKKKAATKSILFFGNSLTAGMGLEEDEAYPALIQEKLDSLSEAYNVINAGLSGETTASGKNRLSWVLNQRVDIFVLELGANDGLRGIPLSETRSNLQEIIDAVKEHNKDVRILLAGMQIPPNMGPQYTNEFKMIYPELAAQNDVSLIPFLLKDVAGVPELNQADGIHPTEAGQKIVADNVWVVLKTVL